MERRNFGTTGSDVTAMAVRGGLGAIPIAGPALAEIVGAIIPEQRMDRISAYLEILQNHLPETFLEELKSIPEKLAFLEDGMMSAGLTPYTDRLERISYAVVNGLKKEEFEADHQGIILRIAAELNRAEAIILGYYGQTGGDLITIAQADAYKKKFAEIWPSYPSSKFKGERPTDAEFSEHGRQMEQYKKTETMREGYIQHLTSLNLIEDERKTPLFPDVGRRTGSSSNVDYSSNIHALQDAIKNLTKDPNYRITALGLEVLVAIKKPDAEA